MPMAISTGKYAMKSIIDCLGRPLSEAYIETSSNSTQTVITSAQSTFFQPSIGTQTGEVVTATSASFSAVASGGAAPSGSSSAGGSTPSNAAGRAAGMGGFVPVVISLAGVAAGMAFIA